MGLLVAGISPLTPELIPVGLDPLAGLDSRRRNRRKGLFATFLGVAIAVGIIAPSVIGGQLHGASGTMVCAVTGVATSEAVWTPLMIVTSPPQGNADGFTQGDGIAQHQWVGGVANGSASGVYADVNWTIERLGLVPGASFWNGSACPAPFVAVVNQTTGSAAGRVCQLQGPSPSDWGLDVNKSNPACPFLGTANVGWLNASFGNSLHCSSWGCYLFVGANSRSPFANSVGDLGISVPFSLSGVMYWTQGLLPGSVTVQYNLTGPGCFQPREYNAVFPSNTFLTWGPMLTSCPPP